uniref:hypothetical protein n=1 Tax=Yoonia sp. TaxID=2212373 RepID=UPI0040479457
MSASKDTFMSVRLQAEIDEDIWSTLPEEYRDKFKVKRIEVETIQGQEAKEVYKKCPTWVKLHEQMIEAVKAQKEREEEIRIELRNK